MTSFLILVLFVLVVWLVVKSRESTQRLAKLEAQLADLAIDLFRLQRGQTPPPAAEQSLAGREPSRPAPEPPVMASSGEPLAVQRPVSPATPPPLPPLIPTTEEAFARATVPDQIPPAPALMPPARKPVAAINWESFLGVKLFAWLGGFALFLGVAFFVKYSFEHNLISSQMRVAIGYAAGFGLLIVGLLIPRARHVVTVQTLCATSVLVFYAVTFAAHSRYHFLGVLPAFALMTLVTAAAFVLAVRLEAQVIAVLGLLGGFLTPPLLSTGVDNPLGLFSYLALLDAGLIAVALRKRWNYLVLLGAVATVVMQAVWVAEFFAEEKILTGMAIFLGFTALFVGGFAAAHRLKRAENWHSAAGILMAAAPLVFALYLLWHPYPALAKEIGQLFGFVFLADLGFLTLAWLRDDLRPAHVAAGAGVFLLLTSWTMQYLTVDLLNPALAFYLLFAALHSVFPIVLQKLRPATMPLAWVHLFPPLALALILVPLLKLASTSFLVWPVVLMIDLMAIVLAVITASLLAVLIVFVLTVLATAIWIFQLPPNLPEVPGMLVVIGGFAVFFMTSGVFAARKVFGKAPAASTGDSNGSAILSGVPALTPQVFNQMMSLAAMLPFLLLTLVVFRLPLVNPAPVFGLAALLVIVLLGLVRAYELDWLAPVSLLSVLLVEGVWHFHRFNSNNAIGPIAWYLGVSFAFLVFPFLFRTRFEKRPLPWVAAALALPLHFVLIHLGFKAALPGFAFPGLVPVVLALPCLMGLRELARPWPAPNRERVTQVALFGGAALFFITLIFPIQFERQWITVGWALEGAALLWLFRRVPEPGLRLVGLGLLVVAFTRLAFNPWVITAYGRTGTPIWNWYLYAYGMVSACLLLGGWLLAPPRHRVRGYDMRPLLFSLGTVLAFALVNIEIADSFSPPGAQLTLNFSGNFAQDMTYSLAWAVFAFVLLAIGFKLRNAATRYAGMGLLVITLFKLFLHDLWRLGGLYRIGSLVGLAVVLIVVSFIYQRFLSSETMKGKASPS